MRKRWEFTGLICGIFAVLIGIGPFISSDEYLLLKSISLYFGFAYATVSAVFIIRERYERTRRLLGLAGFAFVFGGSLLISFVAPEVWPGTSSVSGLYSANGFAWVFIATMMYSVFNYGSSRELVIYSLSVGMLVLSMYPLVDSVLKVLEAGSPDVVVKYLTPLLLIYGIAIIASIPLYIVGQSIDRNRQMSARIRRSKPVAIAIICSIYVISFLIGFSYYHPPLLRWGSISFIVVTIVPAILVSYFTWKRSFRLLSNLQT